MNQKFDTNSQIIDSVKIRNGISKIQLSAGCGETKVRRACFNASHEVRGA